MTIYDARLIRRRATKQEMADRKSGLFDIVSEGQPMTVRQVFYQATVRDLVEKDERGYAKVQRMLVQMRLEKSIPFHWITDNTRWQRKPTTYDSIADALAETARFYRRNLWRDAEVYVEIWLEKDALAGVIFPVTAEYDVPLMVARGFSSISFLHSAAQDINEDGRPAFIFHLGDFDPSGVAAAEHIRDNLRRFAPRSEIHFERLGVTLDQIREWKLPSRPTKSSDTRAKKFGHASSVELDAIHPENLRQLVRDVIERHLPSDQLAILRVAETSERQLLTSIARHNWEAA